MPCYVYVLRSKRTGRFYIGSAQDPGQRLAEHKRGKVVSTRGRGPWELVYCEEHATRTDAVRRERRLKAMKSKTWLETLVAGGVG